MSMTKYQTNNRAYVGAGKASQRMCLEPGLRNGKDICFALRGTPFEAYGLRIKEILEKAKRGEPLRDGEIVALDLVNPDWRADIPNNSPLLD